MNIALAERSATERELDIQIPGENLAKLVDAKIESYRKKIQLPGFRPGKLPRDVVRKRFGASIRAEALEELVDGTLRQAFQEKSLRPVGPGRVEELDAPEGGDVKLKAVVEVDPVIELSGYADLGVAIAETVVTDADVDARLEEIRERSAEVKSAGRPSATGDLVTARYRKVVVEGEERPAPVPVFQAELGKGVAEIDAGLTGKTVGDEVVIEFTFPADHDDAELAGKAVRYEVAVEGVFERLVPELDDALASRLGPFADLAALRERVRADLEENGRQEARRKAHDEAVEKIVAANPFAVPKARIETYVNWQRERMVQMGAEVPSLEEMVVTFGTQAEKTLRGQRVVEWIMEKEGIKATTEEVDARIKILAAQAGISPEDAREELRKTGRLIEIRESLRFEKTLDWLAGVR